MVDNFMMDYPMQHTVKLYSAYDYMYILYTIIMPPNFEEVAGAYWLQVVCASVPHMHTISYLDLSLEAIWVVFHHFCFV